MNAYQLIMKIQTKLQQDPVFANKFNNAMAELNKMPGLQQQVLTIAQMSNEKQRQRALDNLPSRAKTIVEDILSMIK